MTTPSSYSKDSPDPKTVAAYHKYDDSDGRPEAHHHTLGLTRSQASEGSHRHDGTTSIAILDGVTFTGSRGSNTADIINQICNALTAMGAINNTGT